ncbi:MAG TPA: hypothetical protein VH988_05995 [Thermoanaerobaculia bacterium]|jgi:hypothetical protein|nr:hypothetical protein [Thermoanaerobaculia bacterium]
MLDGGKVKAAPRELPVESLYLPPIGKPLLRDQASALHRLRSFYQSFSTAYMNAGTWFNFPNKTGDGAVELWLSGSAYRVRETIDPRLGLASGLEAAYDGEHYQLLYLDDSRLTLSREDPIQRPAPFPDPLFLPLAFLSPESDTCQACVLTLPAAQDNARWQERIGAGRTVEASSKAIVLALPGTRIAGQPFYFRVVIDPVHDLVSRIEWVRQDGRIIKSLELLRYEKAEGSKQLFPRHLVMNAFDEQGKRLGSAHFMVKALRLNAPIDAERFQIPFAAAGTVVDEDAHTFLKHPQLNKNSEFPPGHY